MQVETKLTPLELLDVLQSIEIELGRKKIIDKGPRSIDLDILLYDQQVFNHERLQIPHKLMLERDFVLGPLCQGFFFFFFFVVDSCHIGPRLLKKKDLSHMNNSLVVKTKRSFHTCIFFRHNHLKHYPRHQFRRPSHLSGPQIPSDQRTSWPFLI